MSSTDSSTVSTATGEFLAAACVVVGAGHVEIGAPGLHRDPFAVGDSPLPAAVVRPTDTAQVQEVMRAAAETGTALWPMSRGRNLAYGGGAPRVDGTVVLDLSRMDRVVDVDEDLAYAVVEPGVSYDQLYEHLRGRRSRLWVDVPDLAWGSVIGNALERGNGYTPAGDHWATHCGLQVVLPDGELLHTGMWALPGSQTGPLFPYGYGPYLDGLFSQSGLGVVTRMGVQLQPDPGGYRPFTVTVPNVADLAPLVETTRELRLAGVLPGVASIRSTLAEAAIGATRQDYPGRGPVDAGTLDDLARVHGAWRLYGAVYGPAEITDVLWRRVAAAYAPIVGAVMCAETYSVHHRTAMTMRGIPNYGEVRQLRWLAPDGGHINVSPVTPARGADALGVWEMVASRTRAAGIDPIGTFIVGPRELHYIALIPLDPADRAGCARAGDLAEQLIIDAAACGWGVYRTHLALMDTVMDTYSAGDHALRRVNEVLKDAFDPAGILAPGKQGVWPPGRRPADPADPASPSPPARDRLLDIAPGRAKTAGGWGDGHEPGEALPEGGAPWAS